MAIGSIYNNNINYKTYEANDTNENKIGSIVLAEKYKTTANTKSNRDTLEISDNIYKKSKNYFRDEMAISNAKTEMEMKYSNIKKLVEKLFTQQGKSGMESNWKNIVRKGKVSDTLGELRVDDNTKLKAKRDISEDGYWGVEKTSERIIDFAKLLSGGDRTKADNIMEALKNGFSKAELAFGEKGKLSKTCYNTYNKVIDELSKWRKGGNEVTSTADIEDTLIENMMGQIMGQNTLATIAQ